MELNCKFGPTFLFLNFDPENFGGL